MAAVKWIKIVTDIFDDEKMLLIESLPSADSIIVIWFKLLCLAGKTNNSGVFLLSDRIPYTDEMLATIFRRDINTVRLALNTFVDFGMVEIISGVITVPNWNKHQNLDAYEKKKQRDRERIARKRAEQKALIGVSSDTSPDMSPDVALLDIEEEREEEKEREEESVMPAAPAPAKPARHKYGKYSNVLLSDEDLEKLKTEFPDWEERIERLSEYIASKGARYKSHLATIRSWARKDKEKGEAHGIKRNGEAAGAVKRPSYGTVL